MSPFLLAVDVGNSSTSFGTFDLNSKSSKPIPRIFWVCPTPALLGPKFYSQLKSALYQVRVHSGHIQYIYISSVVPDVDTVLRRVMGEFFGIRPVFISAKTPSVVRVRTRHPEEVGADRVLNARGALVYHKGPLIVVDFGTATTFDCVSHKGEYLGGVIAAGPVMSAEALYQKTAKLPYVHLKKPVHMIGRDTKESILSGLYHGYRGLVKEIVRDLKLTMGPKTYVIATGGQVQWMLKGVPCIDKFIPELTLIGLYHVWCDGHPI